MQKRRNNNRGSRINEAIKEEMALILRTIKDPRIDPMTSIVKVDTTRDLKYCKIYYSVLGDEEEKAATAEGLKSAMGYIRRELAIRINLRQTPELSFIRDDSIEYSIYLGEKLKEIHAADEQRKILYPQSVTEEASKSDDEMDELDRELEELDDLDRELEELDDLYPDEDMEDETEVDELVELDKLEELPEEGADEV